MVHLRLIQELSYVWKPCARLQAGYNCERGILWEAPI
jgi:hypothetical protein